MHINDLPPSILRSALALAAQPLLEWHDDWRRALQLAQVCGCWRGAAMREVYRQLYVFCIEPDANDNDSDDEADDAAFRAIRAESSLPPLMVWHTNANLVAAIDGAAALVREVRVNLRGPAYLFPFLAGVAQQLAPLALARVEALGIHLASDYAAPDASWSSSAAAIAGIGAMEEAAALSDALFCILPRVSRLRVTGLDSSEAFCRFADRLAYHCAPRLRRLEAHYPLSCAAPALGSALAFLHLQVRPYIGQLVPHIAPRGLRRLCLDGVSPRFRWQCFYENEGAARNIPFANLEHLAVHYNAIPGMDVDAVVTADYHCSDNTPAGRRRRGNGTLSSTDRPFWLAFPALRTLAVTRCPDDGGLLACSSFPSNGALASVTLDGPPGAVCALAALVASRRITRAGDLTVALRTPDAGSSSSSSSMSNNNDADATTAAVAAADCSIGASTTTTGSSAPAGDLAAALGYLFSDLQIDGAGVFCLFGGGADPTVDGMIVGSSSSMPQWIHLTELTIDAPLSLATFVAIIRAQPQLTSLACYSVQTTPAGRIDSVTTAGTDGHGVVMKKDKMMKPADSSLLLENIIKLIDDMMNNDNDDDNVNDGDGDGPMNDTLATAINGPNDDGDNEDTEQLNTCLERIVLCNYVDLFSQQAALSLACWLMLSVRSLKYILVSRLNLGHAAAFVRRMETRYPHLKNIEINTS
ncbi:hypothetical protein H4217_007783 [Coemansia sp. RSA 1939]|nr:hypothetical protein H4217_007783 [Coemansia sp. RSA 1939]KAJ2608093.1 hypothetical protein EV177_005160 [Coemansia sp. RSA 1804]KAJ2691201.1 hypothetical protein GGH99_002465 [Coemansia sp. RSA 1285]